jgi:hypothetical protein
MSTIRKKSLDLFTPDERAVLSKRFGVKEGEEQTSLEVNGGWKMAETRDETIARLRERLGREPTNDEIATAREAVIRRAYAHMAMTAAMFLDEK